MPHFCQTARPLKFRQCSNVTVHSPPGSATSRPPKLRTIWPRCQEKAGGRRVTVQTANRICCASSKNKCCTAPIMTCAVYQTKTTVEGMYKAWGRFQSALLDHFLPQHVELVEGKVQASNPECVVTRQGGSMTGYGSLSWPRGAASLAGAHLTATSDGRSS